MRALERGPRGLIRKATTDHCIVCDHPAVDDINRMMLARIRIATIKNKTGLSLDALNQHSDGGHMVRKGDLAVIVKTANLERGQLIEYARALNRETRKLYNKVKDSDHDLALRVMTEMRNQGKFMLEIWNTVVESAKVNQARDGGGQVIVMTNVPRPTGRDEDAP